MGFFFYFIVCSPLPQYKSERSGLVSPQDWNPGPVQEGGALNGKSSNGFRVQSLDQHLGALNLLESQ